MDEKNSENMPEDKKMSPEQVRSTLMKLCAGREMCRFDLERKMEKWGLKDTEQEKILDYLQKEKFYCDKRYVTAFINDKLKIQRWGNIKIIHTLKSKRIPESIIEDVLRYTTHDSYMDNLEDILKKKLRGIKHSGPEPQLRARLYRFALGRGFEPELIFKVLNKLM